MFFQTVIIVVLFSFSNSFSEFSLDDEENNRVTVLFCDVIHDVKNLPGADNLQPGFVTEVNGEMCGYVYTTHIHGEWKLLQVG